MCPGFEVCECGGLLIFYLFIYLFYGGVGGCGFVPVVAVGVIAEVVVGGRCCGSGGCAIVIIVADDDDDVDREELILF